MKILITPLFSFIALGLAAQDYYWVGNGGNWSDYSTHWATSSGGTTFHSQAPTSTDNVYFDANSFTTTDQTVTVDGDHDCHNIDWTGVTNNPAFSSTIGNDLSVYGSLTFDVGASYNVRTFIFKADDAGNTINTAGLSTGANTSFSFSGSGEWTLESDLKLFLMSFFNGTINFNGYDVIGPYISVVGNGGSLVMNLSASTLDLTQWYSQGASPYTLNVGTSTIRLDGSDNCCDPDSFHGNGETFYNLELADDALVVGSNTFNRITIEEGANVEFGNGDTQTFNELVADGSASNLIEIASDSDGDQATLSQSSGTVDLTFVRLKDIIATGGASFNATNSYDDGNNSGWTITEPTGVDYYWVGNEGNWSDFANHWATSSGGSTFHSQAPTLVDNVFFDANSFSATDQTVTMDVNANCHDMDWMGVMNSPELLMNSGVELNLYGSMILSDDAEYNLREILFYSDDTGETVDPAGVDLGQYCDFKFQGTGEWTFTGDAHTRTIEIHDGSVFFTDQFISTFWDVDLRGSSTLDLGSATLEMWWWESRFGSGYTLNSGTSTIKLNGCCGSQSLYGGGTDTFHNLEIPEGTTTITASNTFNKITIAPGASVEFEAGETQSFGELEAVGTGADPITISSDSEGSQATLTLASGGVPVEAHYLSIKDIVATGDQPFEAYESLDEGNNTGWNISAPVEQDYFWVGGTGNWSDLNHWATTSGGSTFYGELPTRYDNVIFDANSFGADDEVVTVDVQALCHDINWTGITNDVLLETNGPSKIGIYGSVAFSNLVDLGVSLSLLSDEAETFSMGSDPEVRKEEDAGGGRIDFEGDGSWTIQDHLTTKSTIFTQGNATLNLNGKPLYAWGLTILGNSTLNTGDDATITIEDWRSSSSNLNFGSNVEITLIRFNQFNTFAEFDGSDNAFPAVSIENPHQTVRLDGSNSFESLSVIAGATIQFEGGKTQTVTNLVADGSKFQNITFHSDNVGEQAIISKSSGTVDLSYISLQDMQATGGATFNAVNSLDNGNNTGWNITAPTGQDYYWIGDGGDWSDLSHWATSSGGSTVHTDLPGSIDDVYFDANSFSSDDQEVSDSGEISFHDVNMSSATNSPSFDLGTVNVFGSVILGDGVVMDAGTIHLKSTGSESITSNGAAGLGNVEFASSGTYTVTDMTHFDNLTVNQDATLIANNQQIDVVFFEIEDNATVTAQNAGLTSSIFQLDDNISLDLSGSTLTIQQMQYLSGSLSSSSLSFESVTNSAVTIGDLVFNGETFDFYHDDADVNIDDWTVNAGAEIVFIDIGSGVATINVNTLMADGTNSEHITFRSLNAGTAHRIHSSSGTTINVSWVELTDSHASGATFNAINSFDNGNNSGWTITSPPDVPDAPSNLMTTLITNDGFTASWDPVADADSYRIDIDNAASFSTPLVEDQEVLGTSHAVTGLVDADDYYWRVRAVNVGGSSGNSVTVSTVTLPETPTAIDAQSIFSNKFTAKWEAVDRVDSYRLDVSDDPGFGSFLTGFEDLEVSGTSQVVDGLLESTVYYYRVRAVNVSGATPNSNVISVTTSTKQDQTITFSLGADAVKEVGDPDFTLSASASSGLNVYFTSSDHDVATVSGNTITIIGTGSTTITARQDGDDNYNAADPVEQVLSVGKAAQVITFDPDPVPDQNLSSGSFSLGISVDSGLPLTVSISNGNASVAESGTPGNYDVTFNDAGIITVLAEQGGDDDYAPASESISFTVMDDVLDDQTITFDLGADETKTYGDGPFTLTASASSGLPVAFASSDESVATISGDEVTIVGAGTTIITASQGGDSQYNPATSVDRTLTVNKADQTIDFGTLVAKTFGDDAFELTATATSGLTVSFEIENSFVASVDGNLLTIAGAGSTNITANQAGDANFNAATSITQTLVVNKAGQVITFDPLEVSGVKLDDEDFSIHISNSTGLGLDVTTNGVVSVEQQGTTDEYVVSIASAGTATISASNDGNSNYEAVSSTLSFDVDKLDQTISFDPIDTKTFGDEDFVLSAESSSGLGISYTSSDESVATVDANTLTIVGAGSTTIGATQSGNEDYHAAAEVSQVLTVNKADQTITFESIPAKTVGDPDFSLDATASSGLTISYTSSDVAVASISGSTVTVVGEGSSTITASQGGNANYNPASDVVQVLVVNSAKQSQTITFEPIPEKTFGDGLFSLSATATSGLAVTYNSSDASVATIAGSEVTIVGAGTATITASQSGDDDFHAASDVEQVLTVGKASQTITFEGIPAKSVGDADFSLNATSSSGLTVSYASSDVAVASISGNTVTITGEGSSIITASQSGNTNYDAASNVTQMLVVNAAKQSQTITFEPIPQKTFGDGLFSLSATASSGLAVTYSSSDASVATIAGSEVTIVGAGTTTITAAQPGDDDFHAATDVEQILTVDKASQTITFGSIPEKMFGDALFSLSATATSGLAISYASSDASVATIEGSDVTIVGAGSTIITASQPGDNNYLEALNLEQTLTVNKASQTIIITAIDDKTIDDDPFDVEAEINSNLPLTYAVTGPAAISGQTITLDGSTGTVEVTVSQAGDDNHHATEEMESFEVLEVVLGSEDELSIKLYPNPVRDYLIIESGKYVDVRIFNMNGNLILEKSEVKGAVNLQNFKSGLYLIEVSQKGSIARTKFYKAN